MMFALTQEQESMRDSVRRLVERTVAPLLAANDRDRPLPKAAFLEIFAALAELGLTAVRLPASAGGPGIAMLDYGIMFELLPAPVAVSFVAHEATIARLGAEADAAQRRRFLPDLVAGRRIACTGATEPGAGSDPRAVATRLERRGENLVLNGRKMWITNVSAADLMLVTCRDRRGGARGAGGGDGGGDGGPGALVKVVLERRRSPYEAREIDTIGLRQGMLGECVFEDCPVPPENVIESTAGGAGGAGGAGEGSGAAGATAALRASWAVNRPLYGLIAVHLAERAFATALDYATVRRQFGKPVAAHQLVQKNLSDIATAVTAGRLLCYHALDLVDRGLPAEGAAAMAKRFAQDACREAVYQAMNVLGALGLATEAGVEALYRDMRMLAVPDGTGEILALIHGRALTGMAAFRGLPPEG